MKKLLFLLMLAILIPGIQAVTFEEAIQGPSGGTGNVTNYYNVSNITATIEINSTTTLDAGLPASVVNIGDIYHASLDFGIPKGSKGDKGDQGDPGTPGINGTNGTDGISATITVNSTTTGDPGTDATVTNIGNSTVAVLDFVIPEGVQGATGDIPDSSQFLFLNGTRAMTGNLSAGTNYINNVVDPDQLQDAATKNYVDTEIAGIIDSTYNASYINKDGSVAMTGNLSLGTKNINNLAEPSLPTDAATKNYVDSQGGGVTLADVYPVGSIYVSTVATNPGTTFGFGTWAAFGSGRVLVGYNASDTDFDTAEETGGSKTNNSVISHTHTISITDPGHNHIQTKNSATTGTVNGYGVDTSTSTQINSGYYTVSNTTGITAGSSAPAGSISEISIVQPYIVVYMWERTA